MSTSTFIIAELSCNHNQNINTALTLIKTAKECGADAVKIQTYKPETITLDSNKDDFILQGGLWDKYKLFDLYKKAMTPWEWHKQLKDYAESLEIEFFSSPFDTSAVDLLESINVKRYKVASFEAQDTILLKKIAQTKKPVILSTGTSPYRTLQEAVYILRKYGCTDITLLKCTSEYPAPIEKANLKTMQDLKEKFNVKVGLSDHTLCIEVPITAVAMGAEVVEKHFTLSRSSGSLDDPFSLEPDEFKQMVDSIRKVEKAIGKVDYSNLNKLSRSLYPCYQIKRGELLTKDNIKSVRPGYSIPVKYYDMLLGKKLKKDVEIGDRLNLGDIDLNITAIIQARSGSTRFPNKILTDINNKPILKHVYDRTCSSKLLTKVVIATTIESKDDKVEQYCQINNIEYYRGSENDVLDRYYQTAKKIKSDIIVRITGDCPLIDSDIIDKTINLYLTSNGICDVAINTNYHNSYPSGYDVEVFSFFLLKQAHETLTDIKKREHVIGYIDDLTKIKLGTNDTYIKLFPIDYNRLHLSVDTTDDFNTVMSIIEYIGNDSTYNDVMKYIIANPLVITNNIKRQYFHMKLNY